MGPGSVADYNTCYAQKDVAPSGICADYFGPGAPKVIGGFDFVGETWPNAALAPDPNPIAAAGTGGHGTHVADIILGKSADGAHKGVAPGAKLYAVKVCSAVSSSCSGTAILQGVDFALDPNGDGDLSDAVDVMNLSLGAPLWTARGRHRQGDQHGLAVRRRLLDLGGQQLQPSVHHRLGRHGRVGDLRGPDPGAERGGRAAGHQFPGQHRGTVHEHRHRAVGAGRRRVPECDRWP